MRARRIEQAFAAQDFRLPTVLLCSEPTAEHCHRRLVVEYLRSHWPEVTPVHL